MSQHIFETEYNGRGVKIIMGWDRPLQGYFMMIEKKNLKEEDENPYIFNNLEIKNSHPITLQPFLNVLDELGIEIPDKMIGEVEADGIFNVGNKMVFHSIKNGEYQRS